MGFSKLAKRLSDMIRKGANVAIWKPEDLESFQWLKKCFFHASSNLARSLAAPSIKTDTCAKLYSMYSKMVGNKYIATQ